MAKSLGRLEAVPVRDVWPDEAGHFTPWLAKSENLSLLADTLNLRDLAIQGTEVPVGNFYIDVLARDLEGDLVLIENQFGRTDRAHLGQIMTYVGGQEGRVTVVWVAETFREEHRAAIDWLNASTVESYVFFAVEIEALKIGDTSPALLVVRAIPRLHSFGRPTTLNRGAGKEFRSAFRDRLHALSGNVEAADD